MKIKKYMFAKAYRCLKQYGIRETLVRVIEQRELAALNYEEWWQQHTVSQQELKNQRLESEQWPNRPMVSICVPLYQTKESFLLEMIESVRSQSYQNWQLCLADGSPDVRLGRIISGEYEQDSRIVYKHLDKNYGIAGNTNQAFALAQGEWIALLDHDDVLTEDALYVMLKAAGAGELPAKEAAQVVYSDEDKVTEDLRHHFQPHWKPDYNKDLLYSNNYITHFFMVQKQIVLQTKGFRQEYDGAQDYDFILQCIKLANRVEHADRVLYHWRVSGTSTADDPGNKLYAYEAGRRVVSFHVEKEVPGARVENTRYHGVYRVKYPISGRAKIAVVIPGDEENFRRWKKVFHTPEVEPVFYNSCPSAEVESDFLLFLPKKAKVSKDWIQELLSHGMRSDVAAVAGKNTNSYGKVVSAGWDWEEGELVPQFEGMSVYRHGYMHRACMQMDYPAAGPQGILVKKDVFFNAGGVGCGDIWQELLGLCLRINEKQLGRIVYTPYAVLQIL